MADAAPTTSTQAAASVPAAGTPATSAPPPPVVTGETNTTPDSVKTGTTARLGKPWVFSDKGIAFLGVQESGVLNGINFQKHKVTDGLILQVYADGRGLPTVGLGHLVVAADKLKLGDTVTLDQARAWVKNDVATAEKAVNSNVSVPLFQYEYDALVSLVFNCGIGHADEIAEFVNSGKYDKAPALIEPFRAAHGNGRRRKQEAAMFKDGNYDATH
jgi:GH24 family phage-related lysozyme (muramidase)